MWEELITSLPTITNLKQITTRAYKSDQRLIDNGHIVQCTTCHKLPFQELRNFLDYYISRYNYQYRFFQY